MIDKALQLYNFNNPNAELIRHNENMTYKITDGMKSYVMRIHKSIEGFNLDLLRLNIDKTDLIANEMEILQFLDSQGNLLTQKVKHSACGQSVALLDDKTPVTVLDWVEGLTIENIDLTPEIAFNLGTMIGKLHNTLTQFPPSNRYHYDSTLLSRMIDEASKALTQKHFTKQQAKTIIDTLLCIKEYLAHAEDRFIIVHTDLGKSNIIHQNNALIPIDFSLSGYCIPEMDLASAFAHINDDTLNQEILKGYESISKHKLDNTAINICFCLQILLFIICQHNKFASESWFQDNLVRWCDNYFTPLISRQYQSFLHPK